MKINRADRTPDELVASCALDEADYTGPGMRLEQIGNLLNLTRERVRQLEERALNKVKAAGVLLPWESE